MLEPLFREESRLASIGRPQDWETVAGPPSADLVLAAAPVDAGRFRPNVVINSFPYTGSITKLSTMVLSYAHVLMKDVYVVSVDQLPTDRGQGRMIEYTYSIEGPAVHCRVVVLQTKDHAVLVTASCASSELSAYDDLLDLVCLSVQLKEEA